MIHGSRRPQAHLLKLCSGSESGEYLTLSTGNVYGDECHLRAMDAERPLFHAISKLRQPDNELGRHGALFGGSQVGFDGAPLLSRQGYRSPVCRRTVAFLRQQGRGVRTDSTLRVFP
jgi:hypothetical protein